MPRYGSWTCRPVRYQRTWYDRSAGCSNGPERRRPARRLHHQSQRDDAQRVASATGFVSGGQQRLDFQMSGAPGSGFNTRVATLQLDASAADLHAVLHHAAVMGVDTYSDDLDLSVRHAALSAELKGSVGWFNTLRSWDEIVSVNGVPLAKVGGSAVPDTEGPTITPLGRPLFLTSEERQILLDFVGAPGTTQHGLAAVLGAGAHLVTIAP